MKVDMSQRAVTARLKIVSQLTRLCLSLKAAGEAHRKGKAKRKEEALDRSFTLPTK